MVRATYSSFPHSNKCRQLISATSRKILGNAENRTRLLGEKRERYLFAPPPPPRYYRSLATLSSDEVFVDCLSYEDFNFNRFLSGGNCSFPDLESPENEIQIVEDVQLTSSESGSSTSGSAGSGSSGHSSSGRFVQVIFSKQKKLKRELRLMRFKISI